MLKAGEKRKINKTETLALFFCHPVTERLCKDLLTLDNEQLVSFFKCGYEAIQALGGEVMKSGLGFGDPEKLIREAGKNAPKTVLDLGYKIETLAESLNG
jgi:hypothetical protein